MTPTGTVRHLADQSRYEYVTTDGQVVGVADYDEAGERVVMHHTHTAPAFRGQGIAAVLVAGALDDLRSRGLRVVPTCWYVAQFIDEHPEYGDLVAV
jgi:predicted GNAT family acetyltransferase